jgi:hypothetical protein
MSLHLGGVAWGRTWELFKDVQRAVNVFAPPDFESDSDYFVDLALRDTFFDPNEEHYFGVRPGMVGRKQRRFVIWFSVPPDLAGREDAWAWFVEQLPEASRLVREYLPRKSKAYPIDQLAGELDRLRENLMLRD